MKDNILTESWRSSVPAPFYSVLTCTGHGWSQDREKPRNGTGFSLLEIWSLPCMCVHTCTFLFVYMYMDVHAMGIVARGQQVSHSSGTSLLFCFVFMLLFIYLFRGFCCLFVCSVFERGSHWSRGHQIGSSNRPVFVSPFLGLQAHSTRPPFFFMSVLGLNSGSHACKAIH